MRAVIVFSDQAQIKDLNTLLTRLQHAGADRVWLRTRVRADQALLAVSSALLAPETLLDATPTVLAQRAFKCLSAPALNAVFELPSITERLVRMQRTSTLELQLPPVQLSAIWAGITPPSTDWQLQGQITKDSLQAVAKAGACEVAAALPTAPGTALVCKVRGEVWGREMLPKLPAGAAFAMEAAGFLDNTENINFFTAGGWSRLEARYGTVLVRSSL